MAQGGDAVEVIADQSASCRVFNFPQELKIYKDPSLFMSLLDEVGTSRSSWEILMHESVLLTSVSGRVALELLGPPRDFNSFPLIAKLYEVVDPRLAVRPRYLKQHESRQVKIIPIKFCGDQEAYENTLGFVVAEDLLEAQRVSSNSVKKRGLPPSTYPNPIPVLPGPTALP